VTDTGATTSLEDIIMQPRRKIAVEESLRMLAR
jgi:hypothetical protein